MEQELKPCPFCGPGELQTFRIGSLHFVECIQCDSQRTGRSEAEAIAAWNTRPTQTADAVEAACRVFGAHLSVAGWGGVALGEIDDAAIEAAMKAALSTQPDTRVEPLSNACIRLSDRLNAAGEAKLAHNLMVCGKRLFDKGACDEQD